MGLRERSGDRRGRLSDTGEGRRRGRLRGADTPLGSGRKGKVGEGPERAGAVTGLEAATLTNEDLAARDRTSDGGATVAEVPSSRPGRVLLVSLAVCGVVPERFKSRC